MLAHPNTQVLKARAELGVASRRGSGDAIADARRNLAAAKLETYVQRILEEAPPLTPEQRDRVSALLRVGGGTSE